MSHPQVTTLRASLIALVMVLVPLALVRASAPVPIAVMPLAAQEGPRQAWLSKGISDLVVRQLAEVPGLAVVEREDMQAFLNEMDLGKAPLFDQQQALRAGRVARVDRMVFGSFQVTRSQIHITLAVLDLRSQRLLSTTEKSGDLEALPSLVKSAVDQLLQRQGISDADRQKAAERLRVSDQLPALEHFYRGLDAYDRGLYADALGQVVAAATQDPAYLDARLWTGKLFEAQGYSDHAVLAYQDLARAFPRETESLDALLLAGRLLEKTPATSADALAAYRMVQQLDPASPQALEAAFQMGPILQQQGKLAEAYAAYRFIERFRLRVKEKGLESLASGRRQSRFFRWPHALSLYNEALTRSILLYKDLLDQKTGEALERPRGVLPLSESSFSFQEDRFGTTPSLFIDVPRYPRWQEAFYVAVAPPGMVITGIDLQVTGRLHTASPYHDFTLRVFPFPMPRDPLNRWIGTIYGQTAAWTTIRKTISFHGERLPVATLQLIENDAEIKSWSIRLHVSPKTSSPGPLPFEDMGRARTQFGYAVAGGGPIMMDPGLRPAGMTAIKGATSSFFEGQPVARFPLASKGFTGATRPSTQIWYAPDRTLALSPRMLITAQGDLEGESTDLWMASPTSGGEWSALAPLPLNSAAQDYDPQLVEGEEGRTHLFWLSNRRGRGWELWTAEASAPKTWSSPRRIPLETLGDPGMEALADEPSALLDYAVTQDRRGTWWLAYYSRPAKALLLARSPNAVDWTRATSIPSSALSGIALHQDRTERYHLAAHASDGRLLYATSLNALAWTPSTWPGYQSRTGTASPTRAQFLSTRDGRLALLLSNRMEGLQYAWVAAQGTQPHLDLVSRAGLQPFSGAVLNDGRLAVALQEPDHVLLRRYQTFNASGKDARAFNPDWPIYIETERDETGHLWRRYTARERVRVPDVTSLAVEPDGRIWWGIETGLMTLKGDQFDAGDVSQGFITNDIRRLYPVTGQPGLVDVETPSGEVWRGNLRTGWTRSPLKPAPDPFHGRRVKDPKGGYWEICGPEELCKGLTYVNGQTRTLWNPPHDVLDKPSSLALDAKGNVWVGTWYKGLYKLERHP